MRKILFMAGVAVLTLLTGCGHSASGYNEIGMENYRESNYEKAVNAFKEAVRKDGDNPVYLANLGNAYLAYGDSEKAVQQLDKAIENKADNSDDLYYALAKAYFESGRYDEGVAAVESFVNTDYKNYKNYLSAYELLYDYKLYKTGEALLSQALELKTYDGNDFNSKGMVYYYLADYENARIYFDRARESGCPEASLNVAKVDMLLENYGEALGAYNYYENNVGRTAFVYNQKCVVNIKLGNYEDAVKCINEALSMASEEEQEEILFNRIVAYEKNGDYDTAYSFAKSYIEKYPDNAQAQKEYMFLSTQASVKEGR